MSLDIFSPSQERRQADARGVPAEIMMPRMMLLLATFLLVVLGVIMVFSASTVEAISQDKNVFSFVGKQLIFAFVGAALCCAIARMGSYHIFRQGLWFWIAWLVPVALVALVPFFGEEILGAKRWLYVGPVSIQPTEFVKISFLLVGVKLMADIHEGMKDTKEALLAAFVLIAIPLLFLLKTQSDLGSTMIIAAGLLAVLWLGEVPGGIMAIVVVIIGGIGAFAMTAGYRMERLAVWLNPWNDGHDGFGAGMQLVRSFYAFAEGGIFGVGLGNSHAKFLYLPEAETDFIFSIIGEELGLLGTLSVIALFLLIAYAGIRISQCAPDSYGTMLAGSMTFMLIVQAFLNIACTIGAFPITGKPLPFLSAGGSSMVASLVMVGFIWNVSINSNVLTTHEKRRNNLDYIRVEHSGSGSSYRNERSTRYSFGSGDVASSSSARRGVDNIQLGSGRERAHFDGGSRSRRGSGRGR